MLSEQLTSTLATIETTEKQVSTAHQRINELEALLTENFKKLNAMQKEIEEGKQKKV